MTLVTLSPRAKRKLTLRLSDGSYHLESGAARGYSTVHFDPVSSLYQEKSKIVVFAQQLLIGEAQEQEINHSSWSIRLGSITTSPAQVIQALHHRIIGGQREHHSRMIDGNNE